jgi:hypothetical protein
MTALAAFALLTASATTAHLIASPSVQASTTVPDTVPLEFTNRSGTGEQVYVYVLGTSLATGEQGYADANGTFHPWPAGGEAPVPAPDAAVPGPADGQTAVLNLPKLSGRVYFSYGSKLDFRLSAGRLVQPAVQNPSDPNRDTLFNWAEYTLNDSGLWLNSTQVDMVSAPYAVGLLRSDGSVAETGRLKPGGYRAFFEGLRSQPGGWDKLVQTRANGTVLRALSPGHGVTSGVLPGHVMGHYINQVWAKYAASPLTVAPFADRPEVKYYGTVSGGAMNFTDGSGQFVTTFQKPDADSVFNCHKLLDAPNDQVRGPISRTLCAGYNRGTLLDGTAEPDSLAAAADQEGGNPYVRQIHSQMADGKAYAFAFDDVGNQESLVHEPAPRRAFITLDPFN